MNRLTKNIIYWSVSLGLCLTIFLVILCVRGDYSLRGFIDPLFVAGGVTFLFGGLVIVEGRGFFDFFKFGVISVVTHMNPNTDKVSKYKDYYDYSQVKKQQREYSPAYFLPFIIIGLVFIVAALIIWGIAR